VSSLRVCIFAALLLSVTCSGLQRASAAGFRKRLATVLPGNDADTGLIDIVGNTSFQEPELLAAVSQQAQEVKEKGLTPARGDDAAYYIGAFYRKNGYARVETEYEIRGRRLIIRVKEGPRTLLRKIRFVGNRSIPEATLYEYMIGADAARLEKEAETFPYTAADVAGGADRVRGLYLAEGFLNVDVDEPGVRISPDGRRAEVTIKINEGIRFRFGAIRFAGETLFSRRELVAALGEPDISGIPITGRKKREQDRRRGSEDAPFPHLAFSPGKANTMQRNLQSFYKSKGYFQAEVVLSADYTQAVGGNVPVSFTVKPDGLFRFGDVNVRTEGEKTRLAPSFLPRRFAHLKGELYNPEKLDETYREMLRTGLYSKLRLSTVAEPDREVRLDFTAEEAKAKEVGFTLGFDSYEGGIVGLRLADRNIFRSGRPLTLAANYSQRGISGELLYLDPWLFDTRNSLRARLFSISRQETGYYKQEYGGRLDLTRRVLPRLELGVFIQQSMTEITEPARSLLDDPRLLGPPEYTLTSIGVTQLTDLRDNPVNPTQGLVIATSFDVATIDGSQAFTRSTARVSYYQPIGKTLLALGARGGYIAPNIEAIPIDVRFFNGGSTTVRSFAERELGPKDRSGNPVGGELFTVFNAELMFPLAGGLQGAVFFDAGNVKNEFVEDSGDMRYAIGLGLRYKLPIGPLRLDYGVNPNPKDEEDFGAFHFSFGFAF
jgi:outer membrane protein insertion porin family